MASLKRACLVVGALTALWCVAAVPARATYGVRTTGDEPHYLLTALSLGEDRDLDVADELDDRRWQPFHAAALTDQSVPRAGGQKLSPHDPLLPAILAAPMRAGGWVAAKATLAALAGALAALMVWTAHRRFAVPLRVAVPVVLAFSLSAPLAVYGTQVYPELPAALAATAGVAAVTGPLQARARWCLIASVVALPWLSVKFVPVAAALAAVALARVYRRRDRRGTIVLAVGFGVSAIVFLWMHRSVYGGWTVYAAGDHFVGGEFTVVGTRPNYAGRAQRLLGLLVDRNFGLIAWAPVFVLCVPAVAFLLRRRPAGWTALVLPLAAGWLTATFVAQTMHGWWWPGRQTVVVLPCIVLAVCAWAATVAWARVASIALGAVGAFTWAWLLVEVLRLDLRLVIDFMMTTAPTHNALRPLLPDLSAPGQLDWLRYAAWVAAFAVLALVGWNTPSRTNPQEDIDDHPITPRRSGASELVAAVHGSVR